MKIWLITDTHFNHVNKMIEYCNRPPDYEERIDNGLKMLCSGNNFDEKTILIHLGDIAIGKDKESTERIVKNTPSIERILIRGNHDKKSSSWYIEHGWDFVCESVNLGFMGKNILLSHKPMVDFGYDINIHGHFHNTDHHNHEPELQAIKNDKQYLLAIEHTNYQPVLLDTIIKNI